MKPFVIALSSDALIETPDGRALRPSQFISLSGVSHLVEPCVAVQSLSALCFQVEPRTAVPKYSSHKRKLEQSGTHTQAKKASSKAM